MRSIAAFPRGRVLARFGVGHDGLDKAKATSGRSAIYNTPGTLDDSVAEVTMFVIGAAARHLVEHANAMRRGEWRPMLGTELRGRTLAIVGCGRIGFDAGTNSQRRVRHARHGYTRASRLAHEPAHYAELTPDFARAVGAGGLRQPAHRRDP